MVKHAQEQNQIEFFRELIDLIDIQLPELDIEAGHLRRKSRLCEVPRVRIDAEYARGASPFHLQRIEAGIAADIEHGPAGQIGCNAGFYSLEMKRRGAT